MENKVGVITEVTSILSKAGVSMQAFSVADGMEFGILRLIVPDVNFAQEVLQREGFKVSLTDVISVQVPNVPGGLSDLLDCLAREEVFIQYMYAYPSGDVANTIIRPNDVDKCVEVLERCKAELGGKSSFYNF